MKAINKSLTNICCYEILAFHYNRGNVRVTSDNTFVTSFHKSGNLIGYLENLMDWEFVGKKLRGLQKNLSRFCGLKVFGVWSQWDLDGCGHPEDESPRQIANFLIMPRKCRVFANFLIMPSHPPPATFTGSKGWKPLARWLKAGGGYRTNAASSDTWVIKTGHKIVTA